MKKLKKYTVGLFSILLRNLADYEVTADQETLHKIRITIKKIRTVFRLISFCDDDFKTRKHFRLYKKIFKDAGVIRSIHIDGKLKAEFDMNVKEEKLTTNPDYGKRSEFISSFIKNTNDNCRSVYRNYFELERYLTKVSSKCFKDYYSNKLLELKNMIHPELIESQLHNARKICKEIIFLSEISKNSKKYIDPFYENLQDRIGNWHDKSELLQTIKNNSGHISDKNSEKIGVEINSDLSAVKILISNYYKK